MLNDVCQDRGVTGAGRRYPSIFTALRFLLGCAAICSALSGSAAELVLAKAGQAEAVIVVGQGGNEFHRWTAQELQKFLKQLSGAELPIVDSSNVPQGKALIVVGGPQENALTAAAQEKHLIDCSKLKAGGFVLKTFEWNGSPALLAGGNDEAGTMYAVYDLLERLGLVFQLTNDIIPEQKPDLRLASLDERIEPVMKYRGANPWHALAWHSGLQDYRRLIDQLAKLKMNTLWFGMEVGSPWVKFSYNGQVPEIIRSKESGYVAWDRLGGVTTGNANAVRIGRECFPQEYLGSPEFAAVQTQEDAYRTATEFLREIIRYAHLRKVEVRLGIASLPYVPPSLLRPDQPTLADMFYGRALPAGDPALLDIWEAMMLSMIETYPDADGYAIMPCEEFLPTKDAGTQQLLGEYAEVGKLLPSVEEVRRLGYAASSREQLESDLAHLCVVDKLIKRLKTRHPEAKLGVAFFFRPYLLRVFDKVLPKDVWLANMENFLNWKPVMECYGGIENRELLVWPRFDDDGCELHMQMNAGMYERDDILSGSAKFKVAGIVGQMNKERGLECNVRYIAEGCWDPSLHSWSFYENYLRRVYGPKPNVLDVMLRSYLMLDENDRAIDWRSGWRRGIFVGFMAFSPLGRLPLRIEAASPLSSAVVAEEKPKSESSEVDAIRKADAAVGHSGVTNQQLDSEIDAAVETQQKWTGMAFRYRQALGPMRAVRPHVAPGSIAELDYTIFKTETFALYFDMMVVCDEAVICLDRSLLAKNKSDRAEALKQLVLADAAMTRADDLAKNIARQMIPFADNPTEKYVLFRFNQVVLAWTENVRSAVAKVLAEHQPPAQ